MAHANNIPVQILRPNIAKNISVHTIKLNDSMKLNTE